MTWGELFSPKISFLLLESWQSLILRADVGVEWENSCKAFSSEHITCGVFGQCFLGNTATELLSMLGLLTPYLRPLAIRKQFVSGLGAKTVTPTLWQEIQSKQYDFFPPDSSFLLEITVVAFAESLLARTTLVSKGWTRESTRCVPVMPTFWMSELSHPNHSSRGSSPRLYHFLSSGHIPNEVKGSVWMPELIGLAWVS